MTTAGSNSFLIVVSATLFGMFVLMAVQYNEAMKQSPLEQAASNIASAVGDLKN